MTGVRLAKTSSSPAWAANFCLEFLASIADSFIYVVSRMGVTGSSATGAMSASLPELCTRVRKYSGKTPIAVGFGVNTREHFLSVGNLADGVVIGSKIVSLIKEAQRGNIPDTIRLYCKEISGAGHANEPKAFSHDIGLIDPIDITKIDAVSGSVATTPRSEGEAKGLVDELDRRKKKLINDGKENTVSRYQVLALTGQKLPARFGEFGGQYVPESLFDCLVELEQMFAAAINDFSFWEEFRSYYPYMNRPSNLQFADRLTDHCGGARIWLKREDLNHTGFFAPSYDSLTIVEVIK